MLGDRIKELRIKKGITQIQLAEEFHVSKGAIGNWESGNREPSIEMLLILANYFDVSVDYLLGRVEDDDGSIPVIVGDDREIADDDDGSDFSMRFKYTLTFKEDDVLRAYRDASDGIRQAVDKLLDIKTE